jgi:NADH dehydrogenase
MGRAMKDKFVTVFGGGGFVGRYVVQNLLKAGARVRIAERNPASGWSLKAQANLGHLQFVPADVTRPETLARAVDGADAVINLVGILKGDFDNVHVRGAAHVAEAAKRAGAAAYVHMSALGADVESASAYGRSRGEGEAAVRAILPQATILRPSIIFGREDQFINRFAGMMRMMPVMPVIGGKTRFQPVFAGDVGVATLAAVSDPARFGGKTLTLGGPQVFSMAELYAWIAKTTNRKPFFVDVPDGVAGAMATATGWLPGAPITRDQWLMLQQDNVVPESEDGMAALGLVPTPIDLVAHDWLVIYRKHGRFGGRAHA